LLKILERIETDNMDIQ